MTQPSCGRWRDRVDHADHSPRRVGRGRRLAALLAASAFVLAPAVASADSSATLTVVGTSDVSDSGLIPNVIQPQFEKAFPQFTFKYIGTATGTAITDAETGSVGASALIVHAASLENQFVAGGFSYRNQYGNAVFTNDFVLAGPKSDPAQVAANGAHSVAQAFADVAGAGIAGKATFVSRGGTPGTTVQEHQIWASVDGAHVAPAGLLLCAVAGKSGGGETPIAPGNGVTASGQPCPNSGALPSAGQLPSWYVATGLTQGPNVLAADACTGHPSGANSCYVLTDRGTFDFAASGTDPAGSLSNLQIVTRGPQSASAPGGAYALVNYFHVYVINPSAPGETVNLTAAQDFVGFLTSPAIQAQLKSYLAHTSDPAGPPFVADASPVLTVAGFPHTYHAGSRLTVSGTLTNAETGYPALAGKPVTIDEIEGPLRVPVASGTTDSAGAYRISFTPESSGSYEASTGPISQVESAGLSPVFGDLLSPAATAPVEVAVRSAITRLTVRSRHGEARVSGAVAPGAGHVRAVVSVLARRAGSKGAFHIRRRERLGTNAGRFSLSVGLPAGRWQIRVTYQDPTQVRSSASRTVTVTVRRR